MFFVTGWRYGVLWALTLLLGWNIAGFWGVIGGAALIGAAHFAWFSFRVMSHAPTSTDPNENGR